MTDPWEMEQADLADAMELFYFEHGVDEQDKRGLAMAVLSDEDAAWIAEAEACWLARWAEGAEE